MQPPEESIEDAECLPSRMMMMLTEDSFSPQRLSQAGGVDVAAHNR
jgi:hypothetical protein